MYARIHLGLAMSDSEIIDQLGGTSRLAALFGISAPSVSEWRRSGIPSARRQSLALLFPDKVPDDWNPLHKPDTAA